MEVDGEKPPLRRSPRKFTPSLKAIEAMANTAPIRKARVKKAIDAIPDTHMDYVEMQLNSQIATNPTVDPITQLEGILTSMGLN